MPRHEIVSLKGRVTDVFVHRFVLDTPRARLADLTPKGAERVHLHEGDELEIVGEAKPSEIKVRRLRRGDQTIEIEHVSGDHHPADVDPEKALRSVRSSGFAVIGHPRRRPKHFEALCRDEAAELFELHIEFDGKIRKSRRLNPDDPKWEQELRTIQIEIVQTRQPAAQEETE